MSFFLKRKTFLSHPSAVNGYIISFREIVLEPCVKWYSIIFSHTLVINFLITLINIWNNFMCLIALFLLTVWAIRTVFYICVCVCVHQTLCLARSEHSWVVCVIWEYRGLSLPCLQFSITVWANFSPSLFNHSWVKPIIQYFGRKEKKIG